MIKIFNVTDLKSIKKFTPKALMVATPDHQWLTVEIPPWMSEFLITSINQDLRLCNDPACSLVSAVSLSNTR